MVTDGERDQRSSDDAEEELDLRPATAAAEQRGQGGRGLVGARSYPGLHVLPRPAHVAVRRRKHLFGDRDLEDCLEPVFSVVVGTELPHLARLFPAGRGSESLVEKY